MQVITEKEEWTKDEQRIFFSDKKDSNQLVLFPNVTEEDIKATLFLLKRYRRLELIVKDYEENSEEMKMAVIEGESARRLSSEDGYANKPANAVILYTEKQPEVYAELKRVLTRLQRANGIVLDNDERLAVHYRYMKGYDYKMATKCFHFSNRTFDRKLAGGVYSMAESLKLAGELQRLKMTVG